MKAYKSENIKNVVLLGHAGSGKTTFSETMLFEAGVINRRGTVEEKNTVSDYHDLEHERMNSIYSAMLHLPWKDSKVNVIDTPGFDDFVGEAVGAMRVSDTAIMLVNGQNGVEPQCLTLWRYLVEQKKPSLFFVNQMDHENVNFDNAIAELKANFGSKITVMQFPGNPGHGFNTIIDVLRMVMYEFPADGGKPEKKEIPDAFRERADALHNELVETIAEVDESLMEKFFDQGTLSEDDLRAGMKQALIKREFFPVFCGCAKQNMGSGRVMGFLNNVAPSAVEMPPEQTEEGELKCSASGDTVLFVYKTVNEGSLGDMSYFKVLSGEVKVGSDLENATTDQTERLNQIYLVNGKDREPAEALCAGDIGTTVKLKNTHTNETLRPKGKKITVKPTAYPEPTVRVAIQSESKGQEDKLAVLLRQFREEDPSLHIGYEKELKQTIINAQGELQLSMLKKRLKNAKIEVSFIEPKIPYRETIQGSCDTMYRHKKQTGGAGQFAEVHMRVESWHEGLADPTDIKVRKKELIDLDWGGKLEYVNCIVGGSIDIRFLPAILKGVMDKMEHGPMTGSRARDIRVSVFDGKMHPVDSNDMAFKLAGTMAFKDGFMKASPVLMEPIYDVEVLVPEDMRGEVMGDLQTRRAVIQGMDMEGSYMKISAKVPLAELHMYTTTLRSLSQGMAKHRQTFAEYQQVPFDIQKKLISENEEALADA